MRNEEGRLPGRPSENFAAAKLLGSEAHSTIAGGSGPSSTLGTALPAALPWAAALLKAADGPIPEYGSVEWAALPDTSRAKVASCVLAAEALRTWMLPEEQARRLRAELEYDEPAVWSPEVVAAVHRVANRPRFAELCDRRGEPERAARAREHVARMREVA